MYILAPHFLTAQNAIVRSGGCGKVVPYIFLVKEEIIREIAFPF